MGKILKRKTPTTVFQSIMAADYETIWLYLDAEYNALNRIAARLPLPMMLEQRATTRGGQGNIGEAINVSLNALWSRREAVEDVVWQKLSDLYMELPRAEKVDVGKKAKEWRNLGTTTTYLSDEALEQIDQIAIYMRNRGHVVPRMLRGGTGSPRVISAIAILFTSRFLIPALKQEQALRNFR